jgi:hypothetical protein
MKEIPANQVLDAVRNVLFAGSKNLPPAIG